jgi:N-carbamoyl-L-amino-acid hydrolase
MPAAMLFPSVRGVSHSFAEDTRAEDIVLGCEVAAEVVAHLLLR